MPANQIRCLLFVLWLSGQLTFGDELRRAIPHDHENSTAFSRAEAVPGSRTLQLPKPPFRYAAAIPNAVQSIAKKFDNQPASNPVTDHGATLGRVLFYDRTLSANGTTSCASCHKQEHAFTDDRKLSIGFDGKAVTRNSMSLVNARYYPNGRMFWDERAESLEAQVLMPIENEIEMGHQLPELVTQLQADPIYPALFESAFGDDTVTKVRIAKALSQFVRSIVSFRSRYDIGLAQVDDPRDPFPNFTDEENFGKQQFFGRALCSTCHLEPHPSEPQAIVATDRYEFPGDEVTGDVAQAYLFYAMSPTVNGIDMDEPKADGGLGDITKKKTDAGRFKVPSLRNVEVTAPYMHDGRFHTLDQVIEHYNWSVKPHPNLDPRLADFAANGMALPEREKVALAKFLLTLTDRQLLKDPRFSNPFGF